MENQQANLSVKPRRMLHIQAAGAYTTDDLVALIKNIQETWDAGGIIATPNTVTAQVIESDTDLSGMLLTAKLSAVELASIAVSVLRGFDIGQGNEPSPLFEELDEQAKAEIMSRIQCVLRLGTLPPNGGDVTEQTRDAIFVATVRALGPKLAAPDMSTMIKVTRVAQKQGDEDSEIMFNELVAGDIFKYQNKDGDFGIFVAASNPYIQWTADPIPVVTIDAKVFTPDPVAPEEIKVSSTSENTL
jgi:hypothetical protein